jgi:hypothetical protein
LEENENIKPQIHYDISDLSIQDMDKMVQTTFMDYVIKCDSKVNQFSVPCTMYKHVNTLIRQYIQDESQTNSSKMKDHIFMLENENKKLKTEIFTKKNEIIETEKNIKQPKGWFF